MKHHYLVLSAISLALASAAHAGDINTAKGVVDPAREYDPPAVSTQTKPSPVGQPVSDYKPQYHSSPMVEPPSPVNRMNPQNDPDVQRGIDTYHQPGR